MFPTSRFIFASFTESFIMKNLSFCIPYRRFIVKTLPPFYHEESQAVGDALPIERSQLIESFGHLAHVEVLPYIRTGGDEPSLHGLDGHHLRVERRRLLR